MLTQNADPPEERQKLKEDTDLLVAKAKSIEGGLNGIMGIVRRQRSSHLSIGTDTLAESYDDG